MNRRLSSAALVAAAALTFSLGSPVAAHAAESGSGSLQPIASAPQARASVAAATGGIRVTTPGYITSSTSARAGFATAISVPDATSWYVYAEVFVNGVKRVESDLVAGSSYTSGSLLWPRSAGYGSMQLRNVRVKSYYNTAPYSREEALPDSNVVPVKRTIDYGAYLRISKRGSKAVAKATKWRVYQPNGSLIRVGKKVKLQRQVKGKWRTYKNIKVNAGGNGKVKFTQKKKYRYRIFIPTTATIQGGYTRPFKI